MKINYKNTALGFLEDPANWELNLAESNKKMTQFELIKFGESVRKAMIKSELRDSFRTKIRYISGPFLDAYYAAKSKLKDIIMSEPVEECGTFIFNKNGFTITLFYAIQLDLSDKEKDENLPKYTVVIQQFSKHGKNDFVNLDALIAYGTGSEKDFLWKGFEDAGMDGWYFVADLLGLLAFLRYCEVETKTIKSNRKDYHVGIKYVNETKNNIEVLDSTWFTTIVKSEGFAVRGHFRMQPYGPGMSLRRLQWIPAFEKEGYTRTAKVLNQQ